MGMRRATLGVTFRTSPQRGKRMGVSESMRRFLPLFSVLTLLASTFAVVASDEASANGALPPTGIHAGTPSRAAAYEAWLGAPLSSTTSFIEGTTWQGLIDASDYMTAWWSGDPRIHVYSVMPFPAGGSYAAGNSGAYDAYLYQMASNMVRNDPDAVVRPAWEHNGDWFYWSSNPDPAAYASYFRRFVDIFRSVPGQQFRFDWGVSLRPVAVNAASYPGDAYVDYIGMSVYDGSWGVTQADPVSRWTQWLTNAAGLHWHRSFAQSHGKLMSYAEWGLSSTHYSGVDPDNTYFISQFHSWLVENAAMIGYANLLDTDTAVGTRHAISTANTMFPNAGATYRSLWSGSPVTVPTTSPVTIPPVTTPQPVVTAPPATSAPTTTAPPATTTPTTAPTPTGPWQCAPSTNPAPTPRAESGSGYWILDQSGSVDALGLPHYGDLRSRGLQANGVAITSTPSGRGYWILDDLDRVHAFGDAPDLGDPAELGLSVGGVSLNAGDGGYWVVGADGGVFSFGVGFHGSMGGLLLNAPVNGMRSTPDGDGYWLVASDGGVFAFGNAPFHGSTGGMRLAAPVLSLASRPSAAGYWLFAADGGIFAFGAEFHGSLPGTGLCGLAEARTIRPTATGNGYWLMTADGRVFNFGDARDLGDRPNTSTLTAVDFATA